MTDLPLYLRPLLEACARGMAAGQDQVSVDLSRTTEIFGQTGGPAAIVACFAETVERQAPGWTVRSVDRDLGATVVSGPSLLLAVCPATAPPSPLRELGPDDRVYLVMPDRSYACGRARLASPEEVAQSRALGAKHVADAAQRRAAIARVEVSEAILNAALHQEFLRQYAELPQTTPQHLELRRLLRPYTAPDTAFGYPEVKYACTKAGWDLVRFLRSALVTPPAP